MPGIERCFARLAARRHLALGAALACMLPLAQAARPYPTRATPLPQDVGAVAAAEPITATVALKLRDAAGLERLVASLYTPESAEFHRFLTPEQFRARFAPSAQAVAEATAYFRQAGLAVRLKSGHLLEVSGTPAAVQAAFGVTLRQYEVAGRNGAVGYRFHAPLQSPSIASPAVAANVAAVLGLDDSPRFVPLSHRAPGALAAARHAATAPAAGGNPPGEWTVTDLAKHYNVQPLYDRGVHGEGHTVGIVTLASFTPSDAYAYWSGLGLQVDPNRIRVVDIDGGPGAPSDDAGSGETTLDVEQSGGVAPAAKVVVYQAPNTDQAFLDAFAQAVDDNTAESVSVSWGEWEWFGTQSLVAGRRGRSVELLKAFDSLFVQAAVQGQTLFAASGDAGAYDVNRAAPVPDYSKTLSVDMPASSPWITAAGGTTLPGTQVYNGPGGVAFPIDIPTEQAWGWSYLTGLCAALGYDPVACGTFPVGSGGGVSSYEALPFYQRNVPGMRVTEAGQSLVDETTSPPTVIAELPAGYAGRNVPDVSLNADPETGYIVVYTSDQTGFGTLDYYGGTSFVAPQLNGIAALLSQKAGERIGLLNPALYRIARGPTAAVHDIDAGDNWFYTGTAGYEPATGVGTLDVAKFARVLTRAH